MRLIALIPVMFLTGCPDGVVRPDPPPTIVEKVVRVYVPVPDELTKPCPIATGPLSQIPDVARARRQSLENCNADKAAIRKIQGTPTPKEETP